MVAGGGRDLPLEIIDLINSKLTSDIVVDENGSKLGATGGILQNQLLICGGHDGRSYYNGTRNVSIIGMPSHGFEMMIPRNHTSSIVLNESKIWVTGGNCDFGGKYTLHQQYYKSTEIISLDQPTVSGPDLPFTVWGHSMVLVDPTTIYLIGGFQNDDSSNKTWIIDPTNNFEIKAGPPLNFARLRHSCAKMRIDGRIFLVVAAGFDDGPLDSVELLDTTCPDQGWKMGM